MAILKNHKITGTLGAALAYITKDKREAAGSEKDDVKDAIAYATDDKTGEVVYKTKRSCLNCSNPNDPYASFRAVIREYGSDEIKYGNRQTKDNAPVLAWHYIQSFEGRVDPDVAHEIGRKFAAEVFPVHPVTIGTHTNTGNTHNHMIICAWNLDGKKWNQCNRAYRHAREVSDRLCDEYGVGVLEATRKQKLVQWTDKDGGIHYYEPTDRKNEKIRERAEGEISRDDVGSYRNTYRYDESENRRLTNREVVKRDIDTFIPVAESFGDMLRRMREAGYTISDRKKDGGWLKYVSYKPPGAERAVRDSRLSEDGYYMRENLEKVIAQQAAERAARREADKKKRHVYYFEDYVYGETDTSKIDEEYRAVKNEDGTCRAVKRGEPEKALVRDVKAKDLEVRGLIDTTELERIIREQKDRPKGKDGRLPAKREEILIRQIQDSFFSLRMMEKENIFTNQEFNAAMAAAWQQYNGCAAAVSQLERAVSGMEGAVEAAKQAGLIEARIARLEHNDEYRAMEMDADIAELDKCRAVMKKFKVEAPAEAEALAEKISGIRGKITALEAKMETQAGRLADFERCVRTMNRIDKEFGRDNSEAMKEYWSIKRQGEREAGRNGSRKERKEQER